MAKQIENMRDLYIDLLQDTYSAEQQLIKALPKMAKAAETAELKQAFQQHLEETQGQVERLQQIFKELKQQPGDETCEAMQGLVKEAEKLIEMKVDKDVLDAGLIACAQKVEHYEIASYGTLAEFADLLGYDKQSELLEETLEEEKATDALLTELAEDHINQMAEAA
jgi:ferritin-like metal-binding protein YciE